MNHATNSDRRLLIVDDDRPLARMLAWAFEDLGYEVLTAGDCRTARQLARRESPAHALIDFHLPDGEGHWLAHELSAMLPGLNTVLMSADHQRARLSMSASGSTKPLFDKPVRPERLHRLFASTPVPDRARKQADVRP